MIGTWIGKTRSLSLWSYINDYVTAYESAHTTAIDESWFKRWKELIDVHNITKKKRSFEFIAYVITGNPESTVNECLQTLFSLIPSLDSSIIVTNTNENGTVTSSISTNHSSTKHQLPTKLKRKYPYLLKIPFMLSLNKILQLLPDKTIWNPS